MQTTCAKPKSFDEWQKDRQEKVEKLKKELPNNSLVEARAEEIAEEVKEHEKDHVWSEMHAFVRDAEEAYGNGTDLNTVVDDLIKAIEWAAFKKKKEDKPEEATAIGY